MVFSSALFLVYFFPIFLILYFLSKKEYKNIVALVASLVFYAFGGHLFTFLLIGSVIMDFLVVRRMHTSKGDERKFLLVLSLFLNLGFLAYFKYSNFFIETVQLLAGSDGSFIKVALPIGISFFTFQKISYTLDVYREKEKPLDSLVDYTLFVMLFPQLIAGPIVRYSEIGHELKDRSKNDTIDYKILGLFRFAVGLAKKVLIANVLGAAAEEYFLDNPATDIYEPSNLALWQAWFGVLLYAFQIYFDFSGYSDMAIGIGKMLGFNFPENFNFPYIARNITEFWKRWHMTLTRWMRDYLYIPLGGNQVPHLRLYINLSVVFLLSGLWHGASWNFIIWGCFHGLFLILDRLFLKSLLSKIGRYPSVIFTFTITLIGWVIFKVENLGDLGSYLSVMFTGGNGVSRVTVDSQVLFILFIAFLTSFTPLFSKAESWIEEKIALKVIEEKYLIPVSLLTFVLISLSLVYISASGFNPFIYFRF